VENAGVFRGGGQALTFDPHDIFDNVAHVLRDLFVAGNTYYFALPHVEFSGRLGRAAASGIVLATFVAWKWKASRQPLVLAGILCALSIAAPSLTLRLSGLRRSTGFITGAYVAVACVWAMPTADSGWNRVVDWAARLACLVLIAHHLVVYLPNYRYVAGETRKAENPWFYRFGSPDESVRRWAHDWVLQGKPLNCQLLPACRYSEIYAAIGGYLRWNGSSDVPVLAINPESGRTIELNPRSWQPHASAP